MNERSDKWLLAIDTSTEQASIALFDGHRLAELSWPAGRDQTVSVLDQFDHLLTLNKLTISELGAVAVATGPGMFNGLRVGMSMAKGFAFSASLPLIGVPTLDAIALSHAQCGFPVVAVLPAGRGRLLWARSEEGRLTQPRNGTVEDLVAEIESRQTGVLVCGEINPTFRERLRNAAHVHMSPVSAAVCRASAVAELAWSRFQATEFDDPVELEPTYLHAATPIRTG